MPKSDPMPIVAGNSSQNQCIICNLPNEADRKMVQCDGCNRWYHFMCVGVNDSIESEDRSFLCTACSLPAPAQSVASTSTSAREARLQLEMHRLSEEKHLQQRMQEEREKQEKEMQELALRLERERSDKAITAMFALEKDYIDKKYNLLHTQLDDEDDAASVRSRRNCSQGTSKVHDWITRNPPVTLSTNTGSIPTGLTLQTETISSSVQVTSATSNAVAGTSLVLSNAAVSVSEIPVLVVSTSSIHPLSSSAPTSVQQSLSSVQQPLPAPEKSSTVPMQCNPDRPIAAPLVSRQPSAANEANNAFVISPTTKTATSYPFAPVPPMGSNSSYMQNPATPPFAPYQPIQTQASSSARPTPSHPPIVSSSCVPVYTQSDAEPSCWQQPSCFMPAPSYHSTPTSISLAEQPEERRLGFSMQPVSTQIIPGMHTSNPMLRPRKYTGRNVTANPVVGQYISPTTVVSNRYYQHDLRESNQNYVYNPWVSVANFTPQAQQGSYSNALPVLYSDGYLGQNRNSGYQGHEINQPVLSFAQPVPKCTRRVNNPSITNIPLTKNPDLSLPSQEPFRGPNANQLAARTVVPKDLPSFGGNPAEWPLFLSSFETSTQMCGYTEAENLLRLQRCLKGEARKAVNSFLLHPSNVGEIVSTLRMLFGRPDAIIGTLLNDVRNTPTPKPEKLETIVNFGLVVRNLCAHLVSAGQEMHLANPILLQELVDKLPANIKLGWAIHKQSILVEDLRAFADYMNVIINAASSVSHGYSEYNNPERQKGKVYVNSVRSKTNSESSADSSNSDKNLGESQSSAIPNVRPCVVCQTPGHKPKDCPTFKAKKLSDRWKAVQEVHLCKRCLYPHGKWPCKAPACGMGGCTELHHMLLHPGNTADEDNSRSSPVTSNSGVVTVHQNHHQKILFQIIPVSLHANGKTVNTFAFLDGGSDSTLLDSSVAKKLGVTGPVFPLCMQWTNGINRTEEDSQKVQIDISGSTSDKRFKLSAVHTVSSLDLPHQTVDINELQAKFPHLRGLPVSSYNGAIPGLLIGLDNAKLKVPLTFREGREDEPVAAKTRLGWVLYGATGNTNTTLPHRVLHVRNRSANEVLEKEQSFFTAEEEVQLATEKMVHEIGKFQLRHWLSNSSEALQKIDIETELKMKNSWDKRVGKAYTGKDMWVHRLEAITPAGKIQRPLTKLAVLNVLEQDCMAQGTSSNTGRGMCATVQDPPLLANATDTSPT